MAGLEALRGELQETGIGGAEPVFNLTWHDWLILESLLATSTVIAAAALKRESSRGAHYREEFPDEGPLETSRYTVARHAVGGLAISEEPVIFTRVQPGRSLLPTQSQLGQTPGDVAGDPSRPVRPGV